MTVQQYKCVPDPKQQKLQMHRIRELSLAPLFNAKAEKAILSLMYCFFQTNML